MIQTIQEDKAAPIFKQKERPILFAGEMVRAILDGRKTQTRRVIKSHGWGDMDPRDIRVESFYPVIVDKDGEESEGEEIFGAYDIFGESGAKCPFGKPGDTLWVRETFAVNDLKWGWGKLVSEAEGVQRINESSGEFLLYRADGDWVDQFPQVEGDCPPWRPSIHMPRWASRITLEVTRVRVERLHCISEEEALACGFETKSYENGFVGDARWHYRKFWEKSLTDDSKPDWYGNPWVWVIEFKRLV